MSVKILALDEPLGLARGATVICIPVTAGPELLYRCLERVAAHTPPQTPVLVVDESPCEPAVERFMSELDRELFYLTLPPSSGPVALANGALNTCADADAVLLASHALVVEGWLERLLRAAQSDTTVATVSALGNNAGPLSLWGPYDPLPGGVDLDRLAADMAARAPRAAPRTPTAEGHCIWTARSALELVGGLDTSLDSLRPALVDLSQRCQGRGLVNVVADDLFVASVRPELAAEGDSLGSGGDRALLGGRYRYLAGALEDGTWRPLRRSLLVARRSLHPLSVTVDARILRSEFSGAQAETLELIETLGRMDGVAVRALLDPAAGADVLAVLERTGVELLSVEQAGAGVARTDVVHRPYQVTSAEDLELLSRLGERLVITHLDLIAFHNPSYFGSFEGWLHHRRVTRQALAIADRVIFLTQHAADDAMREGLVDRGRVRIMPMVVNRDEPAREQRRPAKAPEGPFLLCIGNDFRHKNRLFAIELLAELRERGWQGVLVLAGAFVGHGSSRGDEAAYLASRPELSELVLDLPAVAEAEKSWLFANAAAAVYPTVYEGFGLIPFEAVRAGTPCLFAAQAALAEMLPAEAAVLVPWDARSSAERALPLLGEGPERRRHLELVQAAVAQMDDWDSFAAKLLEIYDQATRLEFREAASLAAEAGAREAELAIWISLKENMGEILSPDTPLPLDAQRGLVAIASRRWLRRPLSWLLGGLYRIGHRSRAR